MWLTRMHEPNEANSLGEEKFFLFRVILLKISHSPDDYGGCYMRILCECQRSVESRAAALGHKVESNCSKTVVEKS